MWHCRFMLFLSPKFLGSTNTATQKSPPQQSLTQLDTERGDVGPPTPTNGAVRSSEERRPRDGSHAGASHRAWWGPGYRVEGGGGWGPGRDDCAKANPTFKVYSQLCPRIFVSKYKTPSDNPRRPWLKQLVGNSEGFQSSAFFNDTNTHGGMCRFECLCKPKCKRIEERTLFSFSASPFEDHAIAWESIAPSTCHFHFPCLYNCSL